ncbi:MAG: hypothetical protein ABSB63_04800, partial [Spirochaetia bacterium]
LQLLILTMKRESRNRLCKDPCAQSRVRSPAFACFTKPCGVVEIDFSYAECQAEHDRRKRQADILCDHVEKAYRLLPIVVAVKNST